LYSFVSKIKISLYVLRIAYILLKEYSKSQPKAFMGEGEASWKEIFEVVRKQGVTDWYIVEYEHQDQPPIQSVQQCLANLRKMGK